VVIEFYPIFRFARLAREIERIVSRAVLHREFSTILCWYIEPFPIADKYRVNVQDMAAGFVRPRVAA
jgi:hypothetical protein